MEVIKADKQNKHNWWKTKKILQISNEMPAQPKQFSATKEFLEKQFLLHNLKTGKSSLTSREGKCN